MSVDVGVDGGHAGLSVKVGWESGLGYVCVWGGQPIYLEERISGLRTKRNFLAFEKNAAIGICLMCEHASSFLHSVRFPITFVGAN